ncbi:hypothetical protein SAMN05443665_1005102 [Actinomadura meyerae]|jgi:hypothetical protein|uniref:Uncharacterized protein n=1 Tax=Actinomadura meyerae TaxID=240840 RepID=A0A239F1F9_9ACTN|nr:hypothetical protein [Actinomadura meyerae]SNS50541.1 hypothetical protein SAMN05443665_1005102 [Actinomadura meyerae]
MQQSTVHRKRTARTITAFGAAGIAAAGLIAGAVPAGAATLQAAVFPDHVEFLGNESNANVSGPVKLSIWPDGTWNIYSQTRNGRPAFRNVHWTCVVTVTIGSTSTATSVRTNTVKIRTRQSHTFNVSGTNADLAANYTSIINPTFGRVDCDIHFG